MGNKICGENEIDFDGDVFQFICQSDPKEKNVQHLDSISCQNKEVEKILHQFQIQLKQKQSLYRDPLLKSNTISLKSETSETQCSYQRPHKILNIPNHQLYQIIQPSDFSCSNIIVNDIAMQYFGAFLCFICQNPWFIDQLILTKSNSYGLHVVKVIIRGKTHDLLIDDLILCHKHVPIFSQPIKHKFMWTCILQKAWLKLKGYLKKVVKTSPQEVLETFLALPIQKVILEGQQEAQISALIKKHLYKIQEGYGIILTSKQKPPHRIGLSGSQHFYFLGSFDVGGKRLFYLRNPCGKFDFRGVNSSISGEVLKKIREIIKSQNIPEGNFLLDDEQITQQIHQITIIHHKNNMRQYMTPLKLQANHEFFVNFQIDSRGPLSIGLTQHPINQASKFPQLQSYSPFTYQLINLTENTLLGGQDNIEACFGVKNAYFLPNVVQTVNPGKYLLRLKKKLKTNMMYNNECMLTAYLSNPKNKPNKQSFFNYDNQQEMSMKFENFLKNQAMYKKVDESPKQRREKKNFMNKVVWFGDIVVVFIEKIILEQNKKKDNPIMIEVCFPDLVNLQCISDKIKIKKGEYKSFELKDNLMFIFEKIDLTEVTAVHKYTIEGY